MQNYIFFKILPLYLAQEPAISAIQITTGQRTLLYNQSMTTFLLITTFVLGLSESIEPRLPEDPAMIYSVGFIHDGVKVGLDWRNRQIVPSRTCRKMAPEHRRHCQQVAVDWLASECAWYEAKGSLSAKQADMRDATCNGAKSVADLVRASQLAER